jgi:hypothetical protein
MAKNQISVYISDSSRSWIKKFPPAETNGGSVGFVANWAIQQLRRGALTAYQMLDNDERVAVVSSLNGFVPDPGFSNLALHVGDWFAMDSGLMLEWDNDKIDALVSKLTALNPTQTMGLICWGLSFWRAEELGDIDEYARDHRGLV